MYSPCVCFVHSFFIFFLFFPILCPPLPSPTCENPAVLNLNLLTEAVHHHHLSSKGLTLTFPFFLQVLSVKRKEERTICAPKLLSSLLLHQSIQRLPSFIFVPGSCIKVSVHHDQEGVLEMSLPFAGISSCYTAWGIKLAHSDGPYTTLTLTCPEEGNH